jgi:hypothetical protein
MTLSVKIGELAPGAILNSLGPAPPREFARSTLAALTPQSLFLGQKIVDEDAARCCLAALWLLHDFLDESHAISQEIETADGSYWHGIMHRREPDYSNAKYWFRQVGPHPIFEPLANAARTQVESEKDKLSPPTQFLLNPTTWDPYHFIDLCEALAGRPVDDSAVLLARRIARTEWNLLFEHCHSAAMGAA